MTGEILKQIQQYLEMMKQSGADLVGRAPMQSFGETDESYANQNPKEELLALQETVTPCTKCSELASTRKSVVFGSGNAHAKLVFVGEAPGFDEDVQGFPFVGRAGQLLTKIIESISLTRQEVFICNVLKCRPPGNRSPRPDEISNCEPYLSKQIEIIHPAVICALGTFAAQTLLKTTASISSLRGKFYEFHGAKLICTFHPAYLLRNLQDKRKVWEDMKMIRAELQKMCHPRKSGDPRIPDKNIRE